MQAVGEAIDGWVVVSARWAPVVQASGVWGAVGESVCDAEPTAALKLGEDDDHLPVGWNKGGSG